ncbi:MAG: glycine cleavage system protein GcvH [Pseudomonadota bacterium]
MSDLSELSFPDELGYTSEHVWVKKKGRTAVVGITDYAQDMLGDLVYVDLPEEGDRFEQGEEFGAVESTKSVSSLFMPVSGEVTGVNPALLDDPDLVNSSPYGQGWLMEIKPDEPGYMEELMGPEEYLEMLEGLE